MLPVSIPKYANKPVMQKQQQQTKPQTNQPRNHYKLAETEKVQSSKRNLMFSENQFSFRLLVLLSWHTERLWKTHYQQCLLAKEKQHVTLSFVNVDQ